MLWCFVAPREAFCGVVAEKGSDFYHSLRLPERNYVCSEQLVTLLPTNEIIDLVPLLSSTSIHLIRIILNSEDRLTILMINHLENLIRWNGH